MRKRDLHALIERLRRDEPREQDGLDLQQDEGVETKAANLRDPELREHYQASRQRDV